MTESTQATLNNRAIATERALRRLLRGVSASEAAVEIGLLMRQLRSRADLCPSYPPFRLLRVLEAACAYGGAGLPVPFNRAMLDQAIGTLGAVQEPTFDIVLNEHQDLYATFLFMSHLQLLVQGGLSSSPFQRQLAMFPSGIACPAINRRVREQFDASLDELLQSLVIIGAIGQGTSLATPIAGVEGACERLGLNATAVIRLVCSAAISPDQVGTRYRRFRADQPNATFWDHQRCAFIDAPLLRLGDQLLAPSEALAWQFAGTGVWRLIRGSADENARAELSARFEKYVASLVAEMPNASLVGEAALAGAGGRHCDAACILPDAVLLLECKSVVSTMQLVTPRTLEMHGGFKEVAEGFEQLRGSASAIRAGALESHGIRRDAEVVGIVVTLDGLPFPNHERSTAVIRGLMTSRGWSLDATQSAIGSMPQAMDIGALENLVSLARSGFEVPRVMRDKLEQPFGAVGEWFPYLNRRAVEARCQQPLIFARAVADFRTRGGKDLFGFTNREVLAPD